MMADIENTSPDKLTALGGHMIWGLVVGGLLVIRFVTRLVTQKPPKADAKSGLLNSGAQAAHWGLYILPLAMVASGMATA